MASSNEIKSLDDVTYSLRVPKFLVVLAVLGIFFFSLVSHFPLTRQIETLVKTQLHTLPGCKPSFDRLSFEFFLPKVVLTDVSVPGSCTGGAAGFKLPRVALYFYGPSFSPLGLAFKLQTELSGTPLALYYAAGTSAHAFNIQEENFPLGLLAKVLPQAPKLAGNASLNLKLRLAGSSLEELKLLLESKNLSLPAQALGDLKLPKLDLGNVLLKAEASGPRRLQLTELVIGNTTAPLRGKLSGHIELTGAPLAFSPISIKGEAALSEEFLNAFPILNLLLPQFTQKDGFYQISLGGTLGNLRPQSEPRK